MIYLIVLAAATAYAAGAFVTLRMDIRVQLREYPDMNWTALHSFVPALFGAIWPITALIIWLQYFETKFPKFRGPIARLFDHEQRKAEAREDRA